MFKLTLSFSNVLVIGYENMVEIEKLGIKLSDNYFNITDELNYKYDMKKEGRIYYEFTAEEVNSNSLLRRIFKETNSASLECNFAADIRYMVVEYCTALNKLGIDYNEEFEGYIISEKVIKKLFTLYNVEDLVTANFPTYIIELTKRLKPCTLLNKINRDRESGILAVSERIRHSSRNVLSRIELQNTTDEIMTKAKETGDVYITASQLIKLEVVKDISFVDSGYIEGMSCILTDNRLFNRKLGHCSAYKINNLYYVPTEFEHICECQIADRKYEIFRLKESKYAIVADRYLVNTDTMELLYSATTKIEYDKDNNFVYENMANTKCKININLI